MALPWNEVQPDLATFIAMKVGGAVVMEIFIAILVAAGPCGAMPFVIAVQYGIELERIAKAVLLSTVLSVISPALRFQ